MKKQYVQYEIAFRGTPRELEGFEKLLTDRFVTPRHLQDWDDVNNEDNPPSGVIHWTKLKQLKIYTVLDELKSKPL